MIKLLNEYKNGNHITKIYSDGTRIRETNEDKFISDFAENIDIKITNKCDMNCLMCHEESSINGLHMDDNLNFWNTLHPYQEVALGGGNIFEYPNIEDLLKFLRSKNIIVNVTVNQKHFENNIPLLLKWSITGLIYGLGISVNNANKELIKKSRLFNNAVLHIINGIISEEDIKKLSNQNVKILILGYKHKGRGIDNYNNKKDIIIKNQNYLKNNIKDLFDKFKVVSFDNLALEQLDIKNILDKKTWDKFYQGDDGTSTFYIDAVNKQFAKSSTSDIRYNLLDNVDEMFKMIKRKEVIL